MKNEILKLVERINAEIVTVDEVAHVLLKGHLLLEESLSRIIEQYVFHREHISEARLTFSQKVSLARALCLRKNNIGEWDLISSINSLRNELAHRLNSPERDKKLSRVRDIYFREAAGFKHIEEIKKESDQVILLNACAHCAGFLASFESDSRDFRKIIHSIDRQIHPDRQEIDL